MNYPLAEATIYKILGQLGDPDEFKEGTEMTGSVMGQIVKPLAGGAHYEPHIIDFTAKIIRKAEELQWEIVNWKILH